MPDLYAAQMYDAPFPQQPIDQISKPYVVAICGSPLPGSDLRAAPRPILKSFVRMHERDIGQYVVAVVLRAGDRQRFLAPSTMTTGVFCGDHVPDMAWVHDVFAMYPSFEDATTVSRYPSWLSCNIYRLERDDATSMIWLTPVVPVH